MTRRHLTLALLLLTFGLAFAGCGGDDDDGDAAATTASTGGEAAGTTLNGSVGPGFEISLDGTDGLQPGGVEVSTDVSAEGEESFDVTLETGEYTFVCDPHASQMRGTFTVG